MEKFEPHLNMLATFIGRPLDEAERRRITLLFQYVIAEAVMEHLCEKHPEIKPAIEQVSTKPI